MLRLPPTSIGLDQKDLEVIKKRLNERMSLYQQGYRKSQLIAYHEEIQSSIKRDQENLTEHASRTSSYASPRTEIVHSDSGVETESECSNSGHAPGLAVTCKLILCKWRRAADEYSIIAPGFTSSGPTISYISCEAQLSSPLSPERFFDVPRSPLWAT